jgi:pimeloyl-ACP methyl ester carboxylesterase
MKTLSVRCRLALVLGFALLTGATGWAEDLKSRLMEAGVTVTKDASFHGFAEVDFALPGDGSACKIVFPKQAAPGNPWVWRALFWDHEPAFDVAMIEHGYHLVYCDVSPLWGAPAAVARWDKFHALAQKIGLGPKPVLEGLSRGGAIIFNWAKVNPTKVAAIYGDNPLLDIRAFPNTAEAQGSRRECFAAYGITEEQLADFKGSPIDGLEALAAARVPVFLVLGAKDDVVPIAKHADVLEGRYKALGGSVTRWVKPEDGHHPHGLAPVTPLVDAVLAAAAGK